MSNIKIQNEISSITTGPRQSNFELLRIIAMFLVLAVHANYASIGQPTATDFAVAPLASLTRVFMQALCIMCVNLFILISGWFGIRPSAKGLCNFIFQWLFIFCGVYAIMILTGRAPLSAKGIAACFCLHSGGWFIKSYLALYLLSPVLNAWTERASKRQQLYLLIAFFTFQTIFGTYHSAKFILSGYSAFSFIGLYLLANYIHRYCSTTYQLGGVIFTASLLLLTIQGCMNVFYRHVPNAFDYSNPLVISEAVGFMLFFSNLKMGHNRFINFVAKSSFAVFLLHTYYYVWEDLFTPMCKDVFHSYSGLEYLSFISCILIGIFILAIIVDQPRKWLWKAISNRLFR